MQKYLETRGIDEKGKLEKKIKNMDANVSDADATELANNLFYWLTKWFKKNIEEPSDDVIISKVLQKKAKWDEWRKVLAPLILY